MSRFMESVMSSRELGGASVLLCLAFALRFTTLNPMRSPDTPQADSLGAARLAVLIMRAFVADSARDKLRYVIAGDSAATLDSASAIVARMEKPLRCQARLESGRSLVLNCETIRDHHVLIMMENHASRVLQGLARQANSECMTRSEGGLVLVEVGNDQEVVQWSVVEAWVRGYFILHSLSIAPARCDNVRPRIAVELKIGPPGRFMLILDENSKRSPK